MIDDNKMPVDPSLITWARERAGYTLTNAQSTPSLKKIQEWEDGTLHPTYRQVEVMSDVFRIPVAVFFFPKPPSVPPIDENFRTLPRRTVQGVPSRIRLLLRKARAFQINLFELHEGRNPSSKLITREIAMNSPRDIGPTALAVREYMGVSVRQQFRWPTVEDAFENWRELLAEHGIYVFKDAFREDDFFGFCLYDEEFPIIYVNNSAAKSRQVFTLFHELAHLLFQTSGIDHTENFDMGDITRENYRLEISCNEFSGRFLVPDAQFDEIVDNEYSTVHDAHEIAARFCVSTEVILRKLLDRNVITSDEYEAGSRSSYDTKSPGGGDYYKNQIAYLGKRYVLLALQRYHQNRFDDIQLAEYLNIKPKNVTNFEDSYLRFA